MGSLSKLSERCKKCKHVDDCNEKKMEACAYIEPAGAIMSAPTTQASMQPIMRETIMINTGKNALGKVEIYKDELIEKIKEDIYKSCGVNKLYF